MRGFLVTFVCMFFLTAIIFPVIEILGAFLDMLELNNAILVSSRIAFAKSLDDDLLRDVEIGFEKDVFIKKFKENFHLMMEEEKEGGYNFDIEAVRIEDFKNYAFDLDFSKELFDGVRIKVETKYVFKTGFMKKLSQNFSKPVMLSINRIQSVSMVN